MSSTINVRLFRKAPLGSAPNALAVSPDGRTLYVANGANNAVAVVDAAKGNALLWIHPDRLVSYHRCVERRWTAPLYRQADMASGRWRPFRPARGRSFKHRVGVVSILDVPGEKQLAAFTRRVMANNNAERSSRAPHVLSVGLILS